MTAKNMSRRFALLAAVLSLLVLLSFAVVPGFAADEAASEPATSESVEATPDESAAPADSAEPESGTASETGTTAETGTGTASTTEAATGTEASTETGTTAVTPDAGKNQWTKEDTYRLVINLSVGGVIVLTAVALLIVFRKKIPGFVKALKSECGKIVWCPKDKLKKNSIVVLLTIVVIAVLIFLLDLAFSEGLVLLRNLIKKI
ncbi:MAG: preprotein translocase subunit SecE [Clostridia bacterium]|nr:preprotein translocase subunit SecE [Clostridia bacterium]